MTSTRGQPATPNHDFLAALAALFRQARDLGILVLLCLLECRRHAFLVRGILLLLLALLLPPVVFPIAARVVPPATAAPIPVVAPTAPVPVPRRIAAAVVPTAAVPAVGARRV